MVGAVLKHPAFRAHQPLAPWAATGTKEGGPGDGGRADRRAGVHRRLVPGLTGSAGAGGCGSGAGHWRKAAAAADEGGGVGKAGGLVGLYSGVGRFNMGRSVRRTYVSPSVLDPKVNKIFEAINHDPPISTES